MRTLSFLACVGFLVVVLPVFAQEADCSKSHKTQLEMNDCSGLEYSKADILLNKLYAEKMAWLETKDGKKRFKDTQKAWIAFRDKSCMYEVGPSEESGSIWPLQINNCKLEWTNKRIEDLKVYLTQNHDGYTH